jgi:hypothetical protein
MPLDLGLSYDDDYTPQLLANMGQFSDPIFSSGNIPVITDKNGAGLETIADAIGNGVSNIWYSFTGGISSAIDGMSDEVANYVAGTGEPVGYDKYGQPIYNVRDPRTGAYMSTTTPSYYGGPGNYSTDPQRAIRTTANGDVGFFGRLINSLAYPNPVPAPTIVSSPNDPRTQTNVFATPVVGDITLGTALAVLAVAVIGFVIVKKVA